MKPPAGAENTLRRLNLLAHWLDSRFRIPGTSRRVGLDAVIGLIPGVGDAFTAIVSSYILLEARRLGVPRSAIVKMIFNVGVDMVAGAVPLVGDLFDVHWKANERNVELINRHFESMRTASDRPYPGRGDRPGSSGRQGGAR